MEQKDVKILIIGDYLNWISDACVDEKCQFEDLKMDISTVHVSPIHPPDATIMENVEIVVADGFHLPDETLETVKDIHKKYPHIPIIAATADPVHQRNLVLAGCDCMCPSETQLVPMIKFLLKDIESIG